MNCHKRTRCKKPIPKWYRWPCRSRTDLQVICVSVSCIENWRKRVGVESTFKRSFNNMQASRWHVGPWNVVVVTQTEHK
jgi:hypothetical protein